MTGPQRLRLVHEGHLGVDSRHRLHDLLRHVADDDHEASQAGLFIRVDGPDDDRGASDWETHLRRIYGGHSLSRPTREDDAGCVVHCVLLPTEEWIGLRVATAIPGCIFQVAGMAVYLYKPVLF